MMPIESFQKIIGFGTDVISRQFDPGERPQFFFQFSHGFDIDRLFDDEPVRIPMLQFPGMPEQPTPDGHHPCFLCGKINGISALAAWGHRHFFEGLGAEVCIFPTFVAHRLGIRRLFYVDPALSLHPELKPGTWTLLTDFINGYHTSPLDGLYPMLETPFSDMTAALSQFLNSELTNAMAGLGPAPRLCVYQSHPGAHFCTPSEAQAARAAQADLIGHDLVMEIISGNALGCQVAALALVAEQAPDGKNPPLTRQGILDTCGLCSDTLVRTLRAAVEEIIREEEPAVIANTPEESVEELLAQDFRRPSGKRPALHHLLPRRDT